MLMIRRSADDTLVSLLQMVFWQSARQMCAFIGGLADILLS